MANEVSRFTRSETSKDIRIRFRTLRTSVDNAIDAGIDSQMVAVSMGWQIQIDSDLILAQR
jgi:hypothetical protein